VRPLGGDGDIHLDVGDTSVSVDGAKRRILVTGGAGFIGSHVAEAYLAAGDDVWIVDDLSSGRLSNVPDGARFVEMDIRDPEVRDLFREVRFDLVNHHAAQIDVRVSVSDPAKDAGINLLGLLNLLESAMEVGTRRVVFVSSGGVVYGEPDQIPTPESAPKLPLSPYGVTKLGGEYYLNYYRVVRGMEYVALRYSNVFGPRQDPHGEAGVVAIFCNRLQSGEPLTIFGDGEQTRDYVFVEDVVSANMLASNLELGQGTGLDARAFNVGTGIGTSVLELADILEGIAGTNLPRTHEDGRPGELRHSTLNSDSIRGHGWSPGSTLEQGLKRTFEYIAEQRAGRAT
jgi:UDP-glucose 4-epimerase